MRQELFLPSDKGHLLLRKGKRRSEFVNVGNCKLNGARNKKQECKVEFGNFGPAPTGDDD